MPARLRINGKPAFLLGVNYWSRSGGPRMWDRYDPDLVQRELRQMHEIGLNICRSFCFIPSFMPNPPGVSQAMLQRLGQFLDLCQTEGTGTIPTFLVGHMSGENHDFPGQRGRSPYDDGQLLQWQSNLVQAVGGVCAGHPAVVAYLASNEMPNWGGRSTPDIIRAWARTVRDALGRQDPDRPFSLGDGVANLDGGQNGFDPVALRDLVDFVGPHTYRVDSDPQRQALNAEYCIRSLTHVGLPVVLEEFGCSSTQASEQNQALYYREAIHSCLTAGAAGALAWCFSDFDLEQEQPYSHHAFELGFGITRADGSEKPVCGELRDIARLLKSLDFARLRPPRPAAAIIVPDYFNTTHPFSTEHRPRIRRTLLQAYALCAGAGLEVDLVPERSIDLTRYRLVLAPATQKLLAPTWRALLDWTRRGNTLYWSYHMGDDGFLHGAWCHLFEELTGCRHQLRYGCLDLPQDPLVLQGSGLSIEQPIAGSLCGRAYLPVAPAGADLLATDGAGKPALLRARIGAGRVVFLNHPLELYIGEQAQAHLGAAVQLYRMIAAEAGLAPPIHASDPVVQLRFVEVDDGDPLLWIMHHGWDPVSVTVDAPAAQPLYGSATPLSDGSQTLQLAPKQVAVYRVIGRGHRPSITSRTPAPRRRPGELCGHPGGAF